MIKYFLISTYPKYIDSCIENSILRRGVDKGLIYIENIDLKDFVSSGRIDDRPFGGGAGMVLRPDPIVNAVNYCLEKLKNKKVKILFTSPRGKNFTAAKSKKYSKYDALIIIAGHYEGFDQRALEIVKGEEIKVGSSIVTNGCIIGLYIIDSVSRQVKGFLGNEESIEGETFSKSGFIQAPCYTRPREFMGLSVPDVLLLGNHKAIEKWKLNYNNKNA